MAKGQKRSNKEIRKPKQDKGPKVATAGTSTPMKIIETSGFSAKKK